MDTTKLVTAQVRIYDTDAIPIETLMASELADKIGQAFRFQYIQVNEPTMPQDTRVLSFHRGELHLPEDRFYTIDNLHVEARRIRFSLYAPWDVTDRFFDALTETCRNLLRGRPPWPTAPLYIGNETVWIGTLNLDAKAMIHPAVWKFTDDVTLAVQTETIRCAASLFALGFRLTFTPTTGELGGQGIGLSPKEIRIEPRIDSDQTKNTWFTQSPLRSDRHLQLLEALEADFSKKQDFASRK